MIFILSFQRFLNCHRTMEDLNKVCTTRKQSISIQILVQDFSLAIWTALITALHSAKKEEGLMIFSAKAGRRVFIIYINAEPELKANQRRFAKLQEKQMCSKFHNWICTYSKLRICYTLCTRVGHQQGFSQVLISRHSQLLKGSMSLFQIRFSKAASLKELILLNKPLSQINPKVSWARLTDQQQYCLKNRHD